MTDAATTLALAPDDAVHQTVELGQALIRAVYGYDISAAMALDALLLSYVSLVSVHPQLAEQAQRSLISAARSLVTGATAPPTPPAAPCCSEPPHPQGDHQ